MSEMTRSAVATAWHDIGKEREFDNEIGLHDAIDAEAERLDEMIGDLTQLVRDQGIAQFKAANQGHHPPFLEAVQIGNRARFQAEELILYQELSEQVELAMMDEEETIADQSWRNSPDRWQTSKNLMDDPQPEIDVLVDEVWPEQTIRFRVMAGYLMQTRYEDDQPIPETTTDPLKAQFTQLVTAELERLEKRLADFKKEIGRN